MLWALILLSAAVFTWAKWIHQEIELYTEADNYRVRGQFSQAISLLTQALEKDKNFVEAYYRLGIVYMTLRDYPRANQFFESGLRLTSDPKKQKVFWFDLGESYFILGEYDKAKKCLDDFIRVENQSKPKIDRANLLLRNIDFARENQGLASKYKLKVLSDTVNAFLMQYFPLLTADQQQLILTRRLGGGPNDDEDLVVSEKNERGRWLEPESVSKNINTKLNEGTCTISADGRKLIFTSCVGRNGIGSCDLYESVKIGNDWTEPKNLGPAVNSAEWDVKTDTIGVSYDVLLTDSDSILQAIAEKGYDSDSHRATDEAYDNLPGCCQYDRPEKKK